jgi:cell division septation protein DedD
MVLDYSERRQVNKNRPRKQPAGLFVLFGIGCFLVIYTMGIITGWFLYKATRKNVVAVNPATAGTFPKPKSAETPLSPTDAQKTAGPPTIKGNEPSLTFYYTLPKGEKAAIGSGINPPHETKPGAGKNISVTSVKPIKTNQEGHQLQKAANTEMDTQDQQTAKPIKSEGATPDKDTVPKKAENAKVKYTVQVASYHIKKDAEDLKSSLDKMGLLANVIESKITGKGTWYRVRLGNHLDLETANRIAAKAGKGAIVIPE